MRADLGIHDVGERCSEGVSRRVLRRTDKIRNVSSQATDVHQQAIIAVSRHRIRLCDADGKHRDLVARDQRFVRDVRVVRSRHHTTDGAAGHQRRDARVPCHMRNEQLRAVRLLQPYVDRVNDIENTALPSQRIVRPDEDRAIDVDAEDARSVTPQVKRDMRIIDDVRGETRNRHVEVQHVRRYCAVVIGITVARRETRRRRASGACAARTAG